MPRWPEKAVNAAEQDLAKEDSLILPATGSILREESESIVTVENLSPGDGYAAELAFMEENVEVMVHDSTDPNAENPVQVSCNGRNQFFWRNQPQVVKRKFVEILARAKTTAISTVEARDLTGERTMRIDRSSALRYPFSVIRDENPRGASWLRNVLAQV